MVNPILGICILPTKLATDTKIWINPNQVYRTTQNGRRTNVIFKNGYVLEVAPLLSSFNHKLHCAKQLRDITVGIGKDPISVIADPHTKLFLYPTKEHVHKRKKAKSIQQKKQEGRQEGKELKSDITFHSITFVEQIEQYNYKGKQYTLKLFTLQNGMMYSLAFHQEDFEKDGPNAKSGMAEQQDNRETAIKFAILNLLHAKK
ncbi:hypothetical protein [Bacillus sp. T3]|uniref:hypothetical protein n=1 Tax=Bacillus sp. T3 TaxID=467262 RepID=UPI002981C26D|nr:hypothetical protein [Bacillus sp. T3]